MFAESQFYSLIKPETNYYGYHKSDKPTVTKFR